MATGQTSTPIPSEEMSARERIDLYDAIEKQLTRECWRRARAYAHRCAATLRRSGVVADGEQLAADALADTTIGVRYWPYKERPLLIQLCGVIDSRTQDALKKEGRNRHVSVDWHGSGDEETDSAELLELASKDPETATIRAEVAATFVGSLYSEARARKERLLIGILDLYQDGVRKRADIAAELGISPKKYDYACARLARMIDRLPEELRGDAEELLREIA